MTLIYSVSTQLVVTTRTKILEKVHCRHSVPLNTLIQIFRSLIFPYTFYGIAAWGQAAHSYNTRFSDVGNLYVNKSRLSSGLCFLFSELSYGIAWSLTYANLEKIAFKNKIHQFLFA